MLSILRETGKYEDGNKYICYFHFFITEEAGISGEILRKQAKVSSSAPRWNWDLLVSLLHSQLDCFLIVRTPNHKVLSIGAGY